MKFEKMLLLVVLALHSMAGLLGVALGSSFNSAYCIVPRVVSAGVWKFVDFEPESKLQSKNGVAEGWLGGCYATEPKESETG